MPELGAKFYQSGPARGIASLKRYLEDKVAAGVLVPHDCEVAAAQFIDSCLSTIFKPMLFNAAGPPTEAHRPRRRHRRAHVPRRLPHPLIHGGHPQARGDGFVKWARTPPAPTVRRGVKRVVMRRGSGFSLDPEPGAERRRDGSLPWQEQESWIVVVVRQRQEQAEKGADENDTRRRGPILQSRRKVGRSGPGQERSDEPRWRTR